MMIIMYIFLLPLENSTPENLPLFNLKYVFAFLRANSEHKSVSIFQF
jgi:hypothetical protein